MSKKLSIGFIGTRGIPNEYGGYEAVVQELAPRLVKRGHQVVVYCSKAQKNKFNEWEGVQLVYHQDPEKWIGSAGQFVYDFLSNLSSKKQHHDVIFHMGYTSDSVWYWMWDKKAAHLTNMDGLEWKRTKYSKNARKFLAFAEKLAAKKSNALIADNLGIEEYLKKHFSSPVMHISYGVEVPEITEKGLKKYQLEKNQFDLVIARMVPENNIEIIIKAKIEANDHMPLIIFGNKTAFRDELVKEYGKSEKIIFKDGDFDKSIMDSLRHYCRYYIHGHSVGGTNPSLLEAMAAQSRIIAHDNDFNRNVLLDGGKYFTDQKQLSQHFSCQKEVISRQQIEKCVELIKTHHNWDHICDLYEQAAYKYS
jgi:glycosyltransferase involved in cell wall biosynthesis